MLDVVRLHSYHEVGYLLFVDKRKGCIIVSNAIWFISYKLKQDVSVEDFLLASEKCNHELLSKQKGFVSWDVLHDDTTKPQ
jgi:hypothetical protein